MDLPELKAEGCCCTSFGPSWFAAVSLPILQLDCTALGAMFHEPLLSSVVTFVTRMGVKCMVRGAGATRAGLAGPCMHAWMPPAAGYNTWLKYKFNCTMMHGCTHANRAVIWQRQLCC